jgi:signal transduction histidine kinase
MLVWLHLVSLLGLVSLGFYIFVENPRSRAHQTFTAFIAFLAFWTVKDLFFWNFDEFQTFAYLWACISFIVALSMNYALVVFAWVFPENLRTPHQKVLMLFSPGLVFILATFFGFLFEDESLKVTGFAQDGKFQVKLTPVGYAFVLYIYLIFGYGTIVLIKKYLKYRGTEQGKQLGAILLGLGITVVLKTIANVILPYFENYDFLPYSSLLLLPGVLIYAYAITNFNLFSLKTALDQFKFFPITYKIALSVASVAISSFALFQIPIVWWAFHDGMIADAWRKYLVASIVSAILPNLLLVLIIVRAISRPLQKITLTAIRVINGEYGTEVNMRKTNDEIGILVDFFNRMSRKMASDIEKLQRLNQQLIQAEKLAAMGTLASGLAHEINNPLASIYSLIQMIQKRENLDEDTKEKLKLISSQILRIKRVTSDMMDFARTRPPSRQLVDLNAIVQSSLNLVNFDKSFKKLDVSTDFDSNLPKVLADPNQMQQVFLNILLNARDAMPNGGKVFVRTRRRNESVEVEIADTGIGISKENLGKIFDPFFTTKSPEKGTGLGLAVCYGIITAHEGKIEVESNNSGTKFVIRLPIKE